MGEEGVGGLGEGLDVLGRGCLSEARVLPEPAVSRHRWGHSEVGQIRQVTGDAWTKGKTGRGMDRVAAYLGCMLEVAETIWAELICCMLCKAFSLWAASRYEWGPWPGTCKVFNQVLLNCTGWSHNTKSGQGTQRTAGFKGFRFESSISYPAMILYGFSLGASTTLMV